MTPQSQVGILKEFLQQNNWLSEKDRARYQQWVNDFENKVRKTSHLIIITENSFKIFLPGFSNNCKVKLKQKYLNNHKNF